MTAVTANFVLLFRAINLGKFVGNDNSLWLTNNLFEEGTLWKQPVQKIILRTLVFPCLDLCELLITCAEVLYKDFGECNRYVTFAFVKSGRRLELWIVINLVGLSE